MHEQRDLYTLVMDRVPAPRIELRQLRCLVSIADAGSFTVEVVLGAEDDSNDLINSEVLQYFSAPALAAGQSFSPGPISLTLPSEADTFTQNIGGFATAFLQIVIVSDASQSAQGLPPHLHRGEDWEPLTVCTPVWRTKAPWIVPFLWLPDMSLTAVEVPSKS